MKITEKERQEAKKWNRELDTRLSLKEEESNWRKSKKTLEEDIEFFKDDLPEIIKYKNENLIPKEKWLGKILENKTFMRRARFERRYKGNNRDIAWDLVYALSDMNLKERLADLRFEIYNITRAEKGLNFLKKPNTKFDIEEIKKIPIEKFYTGKLKKTGGKLVGLCPFHNEKTPSFTIYENTNSYYCFGGCGSGGDVIDFYEKLKKVDTKTAIQELNSYILL